MRGVYTALVTPFDDRNEIDVPAFRKLLKDQRAAGVAGVIPCGTTGESPTLSLEEKQQLIELALEEFKGSSVKVIAGTGTNNTNETIELSTWADQTGVDGLLIVTPYYNKPSAAGLENHFLAVANRVRCEITLYNVPGRTGISLTPASIATLSKHPRIRSIKEASGNIAFASEIRDALTASGSSIDILSGDDATYLPLLAVGATGVISVASNLFPRAMVQLQHLVEQGDFAGALKLHDRFYPLFRDLFVESNPVPIKHAMARAGIGSDRVRAPLVSLAKANAERLEASLERCGVAAGATS